MNNTPQQIFGKRVHDLRKIINISQEELAFRSNLNRNYISDIECGRRNVSLNAIYALAKGLNVTVDTLFIK
ncbi:MAG: helix-turn-helix transcriptional regulator [Bacilli bacterium]|jgi:transcriptional regulator with XRE-family HTH domain|nr:helix-turn-helix transcriptional regulator [Bacilli bacterium]MDD3422320.1 helix-turn-helix transcriptional regulator [Bacilli bacterium]MDD4065440.1 helix-turn-helix transcriptional regulator [Bacilli bacterium]